jgi:regulator of replication initiation timing
MSTDRTAEILNYVSAISRDVGALHEAVARLDERVAQVQGDIKELKRDVRLLHEDKQRRRLEHEELVERVEALEGKQT